MSLFGNQNNEFENKLKNQLSETDYKPSDSLWDRIDQEVNRPEFEQKVEGKIGNYKVNPYPETWAQIEAQLPPEPNSKNHRKLLWLPLTILLFITSFGVGYLLNWGDVVNNQKTAEIIEPTIPTQNYIETDLNKTSNQVIANKNTSTKTIVDDKNNRPNAEQKIENQTTIETIHKAPKKAHPIIKKTTRNIDKNGVDQKLTPLKSNQDIVNNNIPLTIIKEAESNHINSNKENTNAIKPAINAIDSATQIANKQESVLPKSNISIQPIIETILDDSTNKGKQINSIVNNVSDTNNTALTLDNNSEEKPSKLSLSILIGTHYSLMHLSTNNPNLQQHVDLRNQIESPKIDWSGGFLIDYEWKKFLFSTGVQFTSFSMGMNYGTLTPKKAMQAEANSSVATTDSVTANGPINTRIKYSWNEIPFLITYRFSPTKRLGIEAKVGISYAIISTVDAALVGPNNVGVFLVKNKESFPYLTNSFFAQTYLGLAYQINQGITLTCMPYLRYSLSNISGKNYAISQQPYVVGISLGIRKHF